MHSWDELLSDEQITELSSEHRIFPPRDLAGSKNQWLRALPDLAVKVLVVDHIENLKGDDDSNLQLVCRHCNLVKNPNAHPRKRPFYGTFEQYTSREREQRQKTLVAGLRVESKTLLRNMKMEPRFRDAGTALLIEHGCMPKDEFIPAACQDAAFEGETISPETGTKYFTKYASRYAHTAIWETYEDGDDDLRVTMVRMKDARPRRRSSLQRGR